MTQIDLDSLIKEPYNFTWSKPSKEPYQFRFSLEHTNIFQDVSRVILTYLNHQHHGPVNDREKIRLFIQTFVPLYFQVELSNIETDELADEVDDDSYSTATEESIEEDDQKSDLLRDENQPDTRSSSPLDEPVVHKESTLDFTSILANELTKERGEAKLCTFFCSTPFYCFFRQYETLYQRLAILSQLDAEVKMKPHLAKKINSNAQKLGIHASQFDSIDLSNGYYHAILKLIDRLLCRKLDQSDFEDMARYITIQHAHLIFTIDKIIHALIKQILIISVDPKSAELLQFFYSNIRSKTEIGTYKRQAENALESTDHVYRIDFNNETKNMTIELVRGVTMEPETDEEILMLRQEMKKATESGMIPSLLVRNLGRELREPKNPFIWSTIRYRVIEGKKNFLPNTEEVFIRRQYPQTRKRPQPSFSSDLGHTVKKLKILK